MIFIANVLVMNGGTTFLLRICRELHHRGSTPVVLLLFRSWDDALKDELSQVARIVCLWEYVSFPFVLAPSRSQIFGPVNWRGLVGALGESPRSLHVMGLFGLIFAARLARRLPAATVTAGVYHQNEFLLDGRSSVERLGRRLFAALPAENIVFFNEFVQAHYATFYGISYDRALLVPIGIDMPAEPRSIVGVTPWLIVSVGNLVSFKTYNRHMIEIVGELAVERPEIRYEIYGAGDQRKSLDDLVDRLDLRQQVRIVDHLPYDRFQDVVSSACLFVGSGTALLEASALGVPSMVGIEATTEPLTYGFLSDITGLTYNENRSDLPRRLMLPLVEDILSSPDFAAEVGGACRRKAAEFSIEKTASGFASLAERVRSSVVEVTVSDLILSGTSVAWLTILHVTGLNRGFANRRAAPPPEGAASSEPDARIGA